MTPRRLVTYDITVLKDLIAVPKLLQDQYSATAYLSRLLRLYFHYRIQHPHRNLLTSNEAADLHRHLLDQLIRHTPIFKHMRTGTAGVSYQVGTAIPYIGRYVCQPGPELPSPVEYSRLAELDEGIPRDLFRYFTGEITVHRILGRVRWFIHFDLMKDNYADR